MANVFITGVSRDLGLGIALVKQYLAQGDTVYAASRRVDGDHIKELQAQYADKLIVVEMDVCDLESVKAAAEVIKEKTGTLDLLISNATASNKDGNKAIDDGMDTEHMFNAYNVNAIGFLRVVQTFLPLVKSGSVLAAITSEQGSMGKCWRDLGMDYGAAKAALNYCCVVLQRRLMHQGLRVLAIHPGWVQTHPAPPKANLTPEESAAYIANTIKNPPPFNEDGNTGVYLNYDGAHFPF